MIPYRLHCLHGWWSHLAWQWSPTLIGLWWWTISVRYEILRFASLLLLLLLFNEKLDRWLRFGCWTFLTVLSQVFCQECLIETPESFGVPFPLIRLLQPCQLASLLYWVFCLTHPNVPHPRLHPFVSFTASCVRLWGFRQEDNSKSTTSQAKSFYEQWRMGFPCFGYDSHIDRPMNNKPILQLTPGKRVLYVSSLVGMRYDS